MEIRNPFFINHLRTLSHSMEGAGCPVLLGTFKHSNPVLGSRALRRDVQPSNPSLPSIFTPCQLSLFSCTCELPNLQPLCFQILTTVGVGGGVPGGFSTYK